MKTGFLFLLQTIYKLASCVQISRVIGTFYHVLKWHNVQQARSYMHRCTTHALYRSKLWQQDLCHHPQNANLDCHVLLGRAQGDENKVSGYGYGLWCGFKWGPHHATSHLWSLLESQHQSVPGCAEECGDPLAQPGGRWQTLGVAVGLGTCPQVQRDRGLAFRRSATTLYLPLTGPLLPLPETAGLLRLVIRREHHQHDLPTTPKPAWSPPTAEYSPSICGAPAGACGKGMLPVPDPYRGGDWGWRWLHWIDVSSTT